MNQNLHPCAAPGCPHQTAYTWCSAVHSPREAERPHRRAATATKVPKTARRVA